MVDETADLEGGALPADPPEKGALKPLQETTPVERLMMVIAGGAVGTSVAAIIVVGGAPVLIAGILSCAMGPFAYNQQCQLTDIEALKETHEAVKREVGRLSASNERLSESIKDLGDTVDRLEEVENALDTLTNLQGQSVSEFANQVVKSREIVATMKQNQKGAIIQNLISVVFASDTDGDGKVDPEEIDALTKRLQEVGGFDVREDKFRAAFSGGSFSALMGVISNLLKDDTPEEEKIFVFGAAPE